MRAGRTFLWGALLWMAAIAAAILSLTSAAYAAPFVVFPKAGELRSVDGRYVVRNTERAAPMADFAGTFHSLYLEETATGRVRKLCDYVGVAAVAWTPSDRLIVTEYLSKRTSRAVIFSADGMREPVMIDQPLLVELVPVSLRPQLRENDHVFVEASDVVGELLVLRVWGYGKHDAEGFRWRCEYGMVEGRISCAEGTKP